MSHPQCRPMTSSTNARECEIAVECMLSIASQILCMAVGAPMVRSVMDMSLSIDPTSPTILRCPWRASCSSVMRSGQRDRSYLGSKERRGGANAPCDLSVWMSVGHSDLKRSAPVSEPSPPHTASASIPSLIRLYAAIRRPSGVRNACERAVPMSVPP